MDRARAAWNRRARKSHRAVTGPPDEDKDGNDGDPAALLDAGGGGGGNVADPADVVVVCAVLALDDMKKESGSPVAALVAVAPNLTY